jgi:molybdate transport system ATP-binding protein
VIKVENVSLIRSQFTLLNNINFELTEGQKWLVTGKSGSGKSSLLDLLAGTAFPTKGKIIKNAPLKIKEVGRDYSFHRIVGKAYQYYQQRYNSQDAEIGPSVWEVLQNRILPLGTTNPNSVSLPKPQYEENWLSQIAQIMHIDYLFDRKITSLSNGETRRTLIAYTLLQRPDVLLLDSPFTGLDIVNRKLLKTILCQIDLKGLVIVSSLNDCPECVTHLLKMEKGEILNCGPLFKVGLSEENHPENIDLSKAGFLKQETKNDFEYAIKLKRGWVKYGDKEVLKNINWEVKKGEKWALTGPNGSGKSSLLSLIIADNPQAYQNNLILFDRKRGTGESIWDLKRKTGFVSPELQQYFPKNQTVAKVIGSGFFDSAGLFRKLDNEQNQKIKQIADLLKLADLLDRPISQLSQGQQRMIFLARALVKNPPLLILDEPCQGLDYNQMVFFRETLNTICTETDKTLVFVTHYEEEIPACVNKRICLSDGHQI